MMLDELCASSQELRANRMVTGSLKYIRSKILVDISYYKNHSKTENFSQSATTKLYSETPTAKFVVSGILSDVQKKPV